MNNEIYKNGMTFAEYKKSYTAFMCDIKNEYRCSDCPENKDINGDCLPCGQSNCWVSCHCK